MSYNLVVKFAIH